MGYIQEQIDYIHRLYDKGVSKLELRFHSSRTEAPLYFLSNFVVKGLVLHESAAGKYPWLMFVDDPSQKEDVYDTLSRDYHKIWKHASPVPRGFDLLFAREEDLAVPTPGIEFRNDVFISYSSKNVDLALEISEDLEEAGINTYLSQVSIQAGTEWKPDIRDALQRSKIILPILTRAAVESRWVIGETFAMWALGKPIIPARAGVEQEDLPEYLRDFQSIDIMTRKGRKALVDSVLGLVDDRSGENEQP